MKLAKRLATMLMCVCLVVPCLTMMVQAATPGKILLGEATAKAGDEVTVGLKAQVDAGIGNRTITISYDSSILQFVSASSTTKVSDGELQYKSEQGINSLYNETELDKLTFKALKDGTATISVKTADVKSSFEITWTYFDGKVTVSGGTPVTSTPSTDSQTTETPDDQTAEEQTDDEVVVNEDAEVVISNTTTITLISDVSNVVLSERYAETTVMMEGTEYPAWQDTENTDMYILYAASSNGVKSLYQYDTLENTYQRYEAAEETAVVSNDNLLGIFGDKANYVVIAAGALLGLFLILVIVLSVKLYNRNAELDEVYDDLDNALAEKDALKKEAASRAKVMPVQSVQPIQVETEDDVLFTEEDEDDPEVEVEFYVEEPVQVEEVPVQEVKKEVTPVEYYDDEDDFYDDLDGDFSISFIDLDE